MQRATVRCSIETRELLLRERIEAVRCSARLCAALLRPDKAFPEKPKPGLQRATVRCSIETAACRSIRWAAEAVAARDCALLY